VASKYLSAHRVEFPCGRARSDGLDHGLAGFGDNTTSTKECIEIFLLVDRHVGILGRTVAPPPAHGGSGTKVEHSYVISKMPGAPFKAFYGRALPQHRDMRPQMADTLKSNVHRWASRADYFFVDSPERRGPRS
jgi:hypothetical protein